MFALFYLSWLSFSYKLVKMLSVHGCVCVDIRLDVNQAGTNRNSCTQRPVILHAESPQRPTIEP